MSYLPFVFGRRPSQFADAGLGFGQNILTNSVVAIGRHAAVVTDREISLRNGAVECGGAALPSTISESQFSLSHLAIPRSRVSSPFPPSIFDLFLDSVNTYTGYFRVSHG
jgi:hypothetical protein